jgi:hypothetical protein
MSAGNSKFFAGRNNVSLVCVYELRLGNLKNAMSEKSTKKIKSSKKYFKEKKEKKNFLSAH